MTAPPPLRPFPVVVSIPVRWGDMDAFAHVNNTIFLRYFETVRIEYFARVGTLAPLDTAGVGPILAETTCRFRRPITFPDTVLAGARVSLDTLQADRYRMDYLLWSEAQETVAGVGHGLIVSYDYRAGAKAPIPDTVRQAMVALEEEHAATLET